MHAPTRHTHTHARTHAHVFFLWSPLFKAFFVLFLREKEAEYNDKMARFPKLGDTRAHTHTHAHTNSRRHEHGYTHTHTYTNSRRHVTDTHTYTHIHKTCTSALLSFIKHRHRAKPDRFGNHLKILSSTWRFICNKRFLRPEYWQLLAIYDWSSAEIAKVRLLRGPFKRHVIDLLYIYRYISMSFEHILRSPKTRRSSQSNIGCIRIMQ